MSTTNRETKREKRKKLAVRAVCLFLAVLMVAGMAYYIILLLASPASAADSVLNTSSLKDDSDTKVTVGLYYGSTVAPEFMITSETGFEIGKQYLNGDKDYEPLWDIWSTMAVSATSDANLGKNGSDYYITNEYYSTLIGAHHIQIDCDDLDREAFTHYYESVKNMLAGYGMVVIPCYIYTGYAIRIGDFATWDQAYPYYTNMLSLFPDRTVTLITPSYTAISVIEPYSAKILFEYDCGSNSVIGFRAHTDPQGNSYMKTPAGYKYDGVFAFRRYVDGVNDGVTLINVLPLEAYIAGVLPYEISNEWPIEVQKEFAVAARSFCLTHLGTSKHRSFGFDLCNSDCCQLYKGAGRINEAVMEAVLGTKGQVIAYNGDIVTSYYSSTVGGVTVSSADCWGGTEIEYLQPIETPWEDYMNHSNGFWISEVSPSQLLERLQKAGYTQLAGGIADVKIKELAKNSTYVKVLEVTDIYGTSVTITYTDKVRTSLTPYVNSANFVVGRGQVEYTESSVVTPSGDESDTQTDVQTAQQTVPQPVAQADKSAGFTESDEIYVLTSDSYDKIDYLGYLMIMTAEGDVECTKRTVFTATKETAQAYLGDEYDAIKDDIPASAGDGTGHTTEVVQSDGEITYKVAYAEDPNDFIFVGKGWGHGVGMSQWGAYDLAVKGYSYEEIILAYFPKITLMNYHLTNNYRED